MFFAAREAQEVAMRMRLGRSKLGVINAPGESVHSAHRNPDVESTAREALAGKATLPLLDKIGACRGCPPAICPSEEC